VTAAGTVAATGAVTANAGVVVDNIIIDGTEIDLSSGDLTVDVEGDISLDANGADIFFKDDGTTFGSATNTSGNLIIKSGTTTALTFSGANVTAAGTVAATGAVTANAGVNVDNINIDGTEIDLSSGDLTVDVAGDISLDADGDQISFKFGGATGQLDIGNTNSGDIIIQEKTNGKDIIFQQDDGNEVIRVGNDLKLYFYDAGGEHISSDGTDFTVASGGDVTVDAEDDIVLDANGGQWNFTDAGATHFLLDADNTLVTMYDDQDTGDLMTIQIAQHGATTITTTDDDAAAADLTMDVDGELVLDAADAAGVIVKINGTSQLSVVDGVVKPTTNNDIDLGTSGNQYKNAYFDGTVTTDVLTVDETATVATSLTVGGGATILTDAQIADDGNFTADIDGDITLDANGGEITFSDNNSATGKVIVDMDNTNIKHQYDASNYVTTTLASTGSVTKATFGAGTTDSDYTLNVDGELVLNAADAAGVIMKINGTSQVSVIDGVIKPTTNNDVDLGTSDDQFKNVYIAGNLETDALSLNGTTVSSNAAELNLLDNVSGLIQADLTKLAAVDATAAEINILDASAATAVASDVASSSGALTSNNYSISHTLTLAGTLADDAVHADVTITSNKVLATSVIIANASIGAEVDIHTVVAGSFKVSIKNVSGSTLADDSTIIINYRVI
jgi:hypothetical protein